MTTTVHEFAAVLYEAYREVMGGRRPDGIELPAIDFATLSIEPLPVKPDPFCAASMRRSFTNIATQNQHRPQRTIYAVAAQAVVDLTPAADQNYRTVAVDNWLAGLDPAFQKPLRELPPTAELRAVMSTAIAEARALLTD